ncbi:hypothetical protein BDV3_000513 [Batrachochytrium dendrobatidis]|uniref:Sterol 24-C-methyltransferase n=1 Tax=Batrachochytrium dendrobatidis (strain JEL423) TaxID=403673 RepID=A0A177WBQ7_BATDL|nr:Delta(24)-sterol C-methyltransferase [Batrachochytrium dendrobatidis]KAK5665183.1 Delta(24)-sterol C-methyltransferase [Batrachochytrium dendrobatidis]OAJ37537.1 hypothetical protein BDEG_21547 [Batrachochytrium dendrobatidis JEL423]
MSTTSSAPPHQPPATDPELTDFLLRLRKKNTDPAAHKSTVDSYAKYWDVDHKQGLENTEDSVAERRKDSDILTNHFYDLVTDFYEYGWGTSFHFARMFKYSSIQHCLARQEDYLALKLGLGAGMKCIDVGCGVGGPLREIVKFSGAHVTGLNNNAYQVKRCHYLAEKHGISNLCDAVKGNFEDMPFEANTFDAAYAIEATCHARRLENPYSEVFRVLKPGAKFACYEWLTTKAYDESNLSQKKIIHGIEEGNSIAKLYTIPQTIAALKSIGFEILEYADLADPKSAMYEAQDPWYTPLEGSYSLNLESIARWRMNPVGRIVTSAMVYALEVLRLAPAGSHKVSQILNNAADSLSLAGRQEIFTPMFFFVARKPLNA